MAKDQIRQFHIGDILSITTGHLVSPRHIEGVYDILNFMTRDNLFTHQLPRASRECAPHLLRQHPMLDHVDASGVNADNWRAWLDAQIVKFGLTRSSRSRFRRNEQRPDRGPDGRLPAVLARQRHA
jgi:hypothetical protein